jgi:hypothetical protein
MPVKVEAQATRHDDEPSGQLASRVAGELPQAAKVVGLQLLEDERVGIHRVVVVGRNRSRDVQEQARLIGDECAPSRIDGV